MKQNPQPIHVESATALVAECDAIVETAEALNSTGLKTFTVAVATGMLDNLKIILGHGGYVVELLPPEPGMAAGGRSCTISVTWTAPMMG